MHSYVPGITRRMWWANTSWPGLCETRLKPKIHFQHSGFDGNQFIIYLICRLTAGHHTGHNPILGVTSKHVLFNKQRRKCVIFSTCGGMFQRQPVSLGCGELVDVQDQGWSRIELRDDAALIPEEGGEGDGGRGEDNYGEVEQGGGGVLVLSLLNQTRVEVGRDNKGERQSCCAGEKGLKIQPVMDFYFQLLCTGNIFICIHTNTDIIPVWAGRRLSPAWAVIFFVDMATGDSGLSRLHWGLVNSTSDMFAHKRAAVCHMDGEKN